MENKTLMTDFYELTMSQVNFDNNEQNDIAYFDGFFRREPLDAGYGLIGGTDSMIEYIQNLLQILFAKVYRERYVLHKCFSLDTQTRSTNQCRRAFRFRSTALI